MPLAMVLVLGPDLQVQVDSAIQKHKIWEYS